MKKIYNIHYTNLETNEILEQVHTIFSYDEISADNLPKEYKTDKEQLLELAYKFEPEYSGKFLIKCTHVNRLPRKYIKVHVEQLKKQIAAIRTDIKVFNKMSDFKLKKLKEFNIRG